MLTLIFSSCKNLSDVLLKLVNLQCFPSIDVLKSIQLDSMEICIFQKVDQIFLPGLEALVNASKRAVLTNVFLETASFFYCSFSELRLSDCRIPLKLIYTFPSTLRKLAIDRCTIVGEYEDRLKRKGRLSLCSLQLNCDSMSDLAEIFDLTNCFNLSLTFTRCITLATDFTSWSRILKNMEHVQEVEFVSCEQTYFKRFLQCIRQSKSRENIECLVMHAKKCFSPLEEDFLFILNSLRNLRYIELVIAYVCG